jgi:hypothetical protein
LSQTPYHNGITHVVFEPLDFLAKLAALVPRPRVNLTRYHGVFAPNSAHRALVTRAGRGKNAAAPANADERTPSERHAAMRWAQRLKRVFGIDLRALQRHAAHHRQYRRSGGDQGDPCAPGKQSAPGARTAAAAWARAASVHAPRLPPGRAPPSPG